MSARQSSHASAADHRDSSTSERKRHIGGRRSGGGGEESVPSTGDAPSSSKIRRVVVTSESATAAEEDRPGPSGTSRTPIADTSSSLRPSAPASDAAFMEERLQELVRALRDLDEEHAVQPPIFSLGDLSRFHVDLSHSGITWNVPLQLRSGDPMISGGLADWDLLAFDPLSSANPQSSGAGPSGAGPSSSHSQRLSPMPSTSQGPPGYVPSHPIRIPAPGRAKASTSHHATEQTRDTASTSLPPAVDQASRAINRASNFFGNLVPRVQSLLTGAREYISDERVVKILDGIASSNENKQKDALSKLNFMFVMGSEEAFPPPFPIKDIVQALIQLLNTSPSLAVGLLSVRCIYTMIDTLPNSQGLMLDAVPCLLERVSNIQCVDTTEQSLLALDILSRRYAKEITQAGGMEAVISNVDFLVIQSQRLVFKVLSNCAVHIHKNEFERLRPFLDVFIGRLKYDDKRVVESVCLFYARIIDRFAHRPECNRAICGSQHELLMAVKEQLTARPTILGSSQRLQLIHVLRKLAEGSAVVAASLLSIGMAEAIADFLSEGDADLATSLLPFAPPLLSEFCTLIGLLCDVTTTNEALQRELKWHDLTLYKVVASHAPPPAGVKLKPTPDDSIIPLPECLRLAQILSDGKKHKDLEVRSDLLTFHVMTDQNSPIGVLLAPHSGSFVSTILKQPATSSQEATFAFSRAIQAHFHGRIVPLVSRVLPILAHSLDGSAGTHHQFNAVTALYNIALLTQSLRTECTLCHLNTRTLLVELLAESRIFHPLRCLLDSTIPLCRTNVLVCLVAVRFLNIVLDLDANAFLPLLKHESLLQEVEQIGHKFRNQFSPPPTTSQEPPCTCSVGKKNMRFTRSRRPQHLPECASVQPSRTGFEPVHYTRGLSSAELNKFVGDILREVEIMSKHIKEEGRPETVEKVLIGCSDLIEIYANDQENTKHVPDAGTYGLETIRDFLSEEENLPGVDRAMEVMVNVLFYYLTDSSALSPTRLDRLRRFTGIVLGIRNPTQAPLTPDVGKNFKKLIRYIVMRLEQREDGHMTLHESGGILANRVYTRGATALRYLFENTIKVLIKPHPTETDGVANHIRLPVRVEPLMTMECLARYVLDKYSVQQEHGGESADDDDDEDDDEVMDQGAPPAEKAHAVTMISPEGTPYPPQTTVLQVLIQQKNPSEISSFFTGAYDLLFKMDIEPTEKNQEKESWDRETSVPAPERLHKPPGGIWKEGETPEGLCPLEQVLESTAQNRQIFKDELANTCTRLLRILYVLNEYWWRLYETEETLPVSLKPLIDRSAFVSQKITAKVYRYTSDFVRVVTQQNDDWAHKLAYNYPFLLPFHVRRNVFYFTALGKERALMHYIKLCDVGPAESDDAWRIMIRTSKARAVVDRKDIVDSAYKAMRKSTFRSRNLIEMSMINELGRNVHFRVPSKAMIEVQFEDEVGTGNGPTAEFFSLFSKQIQHQNLGLWTSSAGEKVTSEGYLLPGEGFYPRPYPMNVRHYKDRARKFQTMGRVMAQALLDSRTIDLPLNKAFFKWLLCEEEFLCLSDLETFDPILFSSLVSVVNTPKEDFEDLCLDFTLPGHNEFDLIKDGRKKIVSQADAMKYAKLVAHWRLVLGVRNEMRDFVHGFKAFVDPRSLKIFFSEDFDALFCGHRHNDIAWSVEALVSSIKFENGFPRGSSHMDWVIRLLNEFTPEKRSKFLQFITGSPTLPVGGFIGLQPPLTVARKDCDGAVDGVLPSAMTCYNLLKLPLYSSYEVLVERFDMLLNHEFDFQLS